jgi:p-hydroxybenzoate 3-monooxygenase
MTRIRTQVGILGAGPAGLVLAHLLDLAGIDSVLIEVRSCKYAEERIRAGVLEQTTVDLFRQIGMSERPDREGLLHHGVHLGFQGKRYRIDLSELTDGKSVTVYAQHEVVKDFIARRLSNGLPTFFEATDASVYDLTSDTPSIRFIHDDKQYELVCDYIAGCDGFHGICRPSIPSSALTFYDREYPFAWLGILAEAPPSMSELVYQNSPRGFALYSMRSPAITRLYLQCKPNEELDAWDDNRIWEELSLRLQGEDRWLPQSGHIIQKGITGMRSLVTEPMQYGRLFLLGDAAHIVPPTGAKGMNLAISDAVFFCRALESFYRFNRTGKLQDYSATCLRRIWKVQRFSWWMTSMLHSSPDRDPFDQQRQLAELDYVVTSRAAATTLAENYVGLPME